MQILQSNGTSGGTYAASSFSNNTLTLTISDGGTVIFSGVSSGDKINVNGTSHTIRGTKLK